MKKWMLLILPLTISACGGDKNNSEETYVFVGSGAIQCQYGGDTLETTAEPLIQAGIDVIESDCAYKTNVVVISSCGAPTTNINLHKISSANIDDAEKLGYYSVSVLEADSDPGHEITPCINRGMYY